MTRLDGPVIHSTAEVSPSASIGAGTRVWHFVQIREHATIGQSCVLGRDVYVDFGVTIGDRVKIQNGCYVYHGAVLEDEVFLGPRVVLTNDKLPRAANPDGSLKSDADWTVGPIRIRQGASVGAGAIVLPNVTVGRFAMIGAGAVVTKDVPDHGLVLGSPARLVGFVCHCGRRLVAGSPTGGWVASSCSGCGSIVSIPERDWNLVK